jgi:periplasmic divalent cation tolerance protein
MVTTARGEGNSSFLFPCPPCPIGFSPDNGDRFVRELMQEVCNAIDMSDLTKAQYGVVLVTTPTKSEAETIAKTLVTEKLAACATLLPVHSIYTWQNEMQQEDEWQLLIKSELNRFEELADRIRQLHSYEVPEIIALPILNGSPAYLSWISGQVKHE